MCLSCAKVSISRTSGSKLVNRYISIAQDAVYWQGDTWQSYIVLVQGDGSEITVEPGLIGGEINTILARHKAKGNHPIQYKIGPDPSSIDSCMVGGMVANNSSGMCCGVSQNTYHTLKDLRCVLVDGTVLDTADPASCTAFLEVREWQAPPALGATDDCLKTTHLLALPLGCRHTDGRAC